MGKKLPNLTLPLPPPSPTLPNQKRRRKKQRKNPKQKLKKRRKNPKQTMPNLPVAIASTCSLVWLGCRLPASRSLFKNPTVDLFATSGTLKGRRINCIFL